MPKLDAGDRTLLAGMIATGIGLWMLTPWATVLGAGIALMLIGLNHHGED